MKKIPGLSFDFRSHSEHAASPTSNGRDGVEADSASHHHGARNFSPATRKSLHLEKRVPGSHGEVRSEWEGNRGDWRRGLATFISIEA